MKPPAVSATRHLLVLAISAFSLVFAPSLISLTSSPSNPGHEPRHPRVKVFVADLPRSLNYGLLDEYWSLQSPDMRTGSDPDEALRRAINNGSRRHHPLPYPESPLIKQHSAEYWLLGDLETQYLGSSRGSVAERVGRWEDADVVFVPFFATLSAELELGWGRKGAFRKQEGNMDYRRQREVLDRVKATEAWRRSGGRDHVFVLTGPVAMWHVRSEIAQSLLLVVDFGGWYKLDLKSSIDGSYPEIIQHTQVSLLKDVIVPYTHLLPTLSLSDDQDRRTLLYFKGAKHRHRGGLVREKLWDILVNEPAVVMEEGIPSATSRAQSINGMRSSEFCLHPAGDTPASCRLFDAIASLCIPVVVSDDIELPFEGIIDYSKFCVFVSVKNALQSKWLINLLRSIPEEQKSTYRANMAHVQKVFEYENDNPGGIGSVDPDGAVNHIWKKIAQKVPMIKETITWEKRKPLGVSIPQLCHCT